MTDYREAFLAALTRRFGDREFQVGTPPDALVRFLAGDGFVTIGTTNSSPWNWKPGGSSTATVNARNDGWRRIARTMASLRDPHHRRRHFARAVGFWRSLQRGRDGRDTCERVPRE
jgi:hypothetical protein